MLTKENHTGIREIIGEFFYNLGEGKVFLNLTKSESSKRNLTSKICRKKCKCERKKCKCEQTNGREKISATKTQKAKSLATEN